MSFEKFSLLRREIAQKEANGTGNHQNFDFHRGNRSGKTSREGCLEHFCMLLQYSEKLSGMMLWQSVVSSFLLQLLDRHLEVFFLFLVVCYNTDGIRKHFFIFHQKVLVERRPLRVFISAIHVSVHVIKSTVDVLPVFNVNICMENIGDIRYQ